MGLGRILVVDDEAHIRTTVRMALTKAGYDVVEGKSSCWLIPGPGIRGSAEAVLHHALPALEKLLAMPNISAPGIT